MTPHDAARRPVLEVDGVSKVYDGTQALSDVGLTLRAGEVHLLLGANGAGKSTLVGILEGTIRPMHGTISLGGDAVRFGSAAEARANGVHAVLQTPAVVPGLSVAENLFLGEAMPKRVPAVLSRSRLQREAEERMRPFGDMDVRRPLESYSPAIFTLVALARAFAGNPKVVLLDEPTAVLSDQEIQRLFALVAELRTRGTAILFTTHRLEEAQAIGDRVTVLKDGQLALAAPMPSVTKQDLVAAIIGEGGRSITEVVARPSASKRQRANVPALEVAQLSGGRVQDATLRIEPGETVGIAGLVGSGRSTLAHLIYGSIKGQGVVKVAGRELSSPRSPRASVVAGLVLCPEDRRGQALFLQRTIRANATVVSPRRHRLVAHLPIPSVRRERAFVEEMASVTQLRHGISERFVDTLSGGNQQKVVVGRWIGHDTRVIVFDEPTAGLDVGAKLEVAALLRRFAHRGAGVLVISSDLAEVAAWSDRVLVMRGGRIAGELEGPTDEPTLIKHCYAEAMK